MLGLDGSRKRIDISHDPLVMVSRIRAAMVVRGGRNRMARAASHLGKQSQRRWSPRTCRAFSVSPLARMNYWLKMVKEIDAGPNLEKVAEDLSETGTHLRDTVPIKAVR